jgi:replicative DNA helicase
MNHSDDDEKVLVGLMINHLSVACEAGHRISSLQFNHDFYRRVFVAARDAAKDQLLSFEEVKRRMNLLDHEELAQLVEVADVRCVEASGRYYIGRVVEASALRKFKSSYHGLADSLQSLTVDDALNASEELRNSVRIPNLWHGWRQYGDEYGDEIQARVDNAGKIRLVQLGIGPIDRWVCGFQPGHLTVICARPKTGKSFLAAKLIEESTVKHDIPGLYCSIEMTAAETYDRLLAMRSHVATKRIQTGNVAPEDLKRLGALLHSLKQKPLSFSREEREPRILSAISEAIQKHKIRYVVIDYLQRIKSESTYRKKFEEVDQVTENLKAFASKNNIAIVLLSQVNFQGSMAFSASSEAHADEKIILTSINDCIPRRVRITVEFQRHGPSGMSCETEFDGDTRFFVPVEPLPPKTKKVRKPYAETEDGIDKLW